MHKEELRFYPVLSVVMQNFKMMYAQCKQFMVKLCLFLSEILFSLNSHDLVRSSLTIEAIFRTVGLKLRNNELGRLSWAQIPTQPFTSVGSWANLLTSLNLRLSIYMMGIR